MPPKTESHIAACPTNAATTKPATMPGTAPPIMP
jgi:hypothetical protein